MRLNTWLLNHESFITFNMKYPLLLQTTFSIFLIVSCTNLSSVSATPTHTKEELSFQNTIISLTFDDGDADNYSVRSVLTENKLHATFYVVSGFTGKDGYLTEEQLR